MNQVGVLVELLRDCSRALEIEHGQVYLESPLGKQVRECLDSLQREEDSWIAMGGSRGVEAIAGMTGPWDESHKLELLRRLSERLGYRVVKRRSKAGLD